MSDQLPTVAGEDLAKRFAQHRTPTTKIEGGFMRFNGKTGQWILGQEEINVEGEQCIVIVPSMMHGWQRWGESPPAKAFSSVLDPKPAAPASIEGVDQEGRACTHVAKAALQVGGKFVDTDLGQFIYNTDSMGGVERLGELFDAIVEQSKTSAFYFPVVTLGNDWYKRTTGKVFKPVFEISGWANADGEIEGKQKKKIAAPKQEEAEEEAPKPRRRKRVA